MFILKSTHKTQIDAMATSIAKANSKADEATKQIEALQHELENLTKSHSEAISSMQASHDAELKELQVSNKETVDGLEEKLKTAEAQVPKDTSITLVFSGDQFDEVTPIFRTTQTFREFLDENNEVPDANDEMACNLCMLDRARDIAVEILEKFEQEPN